MVSSWAPSSISIVHRFNVRERNEVGSYTDVVAILGLAVFLKSCIDRVG